MRRSRCEKCARKFPRLALRDGVCAECAPNVERATANPGEKR